MPVLTSRAAAALVFYAALACPCAAAAQVHQYPAGESHRDRYSLPALRADQAATNQAPAGRVVGRVLAEGTNIPLAGARITLVPVQPRSKPGRPQVTAVTEEDGRFLVEQIAVGPYGVDVEKAGYSPLSAGRDAMEFIDVSAGGTASIDIHIKKGAVIAGRVVDAAGEPMLDVSIIVLRRDDVSPSSVEQVITRGTAGLRTNDLGEFRVSGLAPDEYFVVAAARQGGVGAYEREAAKRSASRAPASTFYPDATTLEGGQPIRVKAGEEAAGLVITMQSGSVYRISGVAVNEDGTPAPGAMVTVISDSQTTGWMGHPGGALTGPAGEFIVHNAPPGEYHLFAAMPMTVTGQGSGGFMTLGGSTRISGTLAGADADGLRRVVITDADVSGVRVVVRRPR